jgi:hypothetical protein
MDFHGIPIRGIWPAIKWMPAALLRRYFPKNRLGELQYIDLMPRGDSATVNLGECASFDVWLNVINLSPFSVEFDRSELTFWFGGTSVKATRTKKQVIEPGHTFRFQISELIPDGMANQIARNCNASGANLTASLSGFVEFNCKLHSFCREIPDLSDIRPRLLNDKIRLAST